MADERGRSTSRTNGVRALRSVSFVVALGIASIPLSVQESATGQEAPTEIVVATNSDESNGDTSSATALAADPGPDGISLREAIEATNNDPGFYTIRFDVSLAGTTITVNPALPPLFGGGVTIDGDIDGDEEPDVTVDGSALADTDPSSAFHVASGGNRLHALTLTDFAQGVGFAPVDPPDGYPTHTVFAGTSIDGLVMESIEGLGIDMESASCGPGVDFPPPCPTYNTLADTTISNNTIEAGGGIKFYITGDGDRVESATITGNTLRIGPQGAGIELEAGSGNSTGVRISDVRIADNSVEGGAAIGIGVAAGTGRAQAGTAERVQVLNNRIHLVKQGPEFCCQGIVINAGGDNGEFAIGPPIRYLDDNTVREVVVRGNSITGELEWGIQVIAGFGGGGRRNRVENTRIQENVTRSSLPTFGTWVITGDGDPYKDRYAEDNVIADVDITGNSFTVGTGPCPGCAGGGIGASGIAVVGGHKFGRNSDIRDVWIDANTIESAYDGILVVGGLGTTASGNAVSVLLGDNRVAGTDDELSVVANREGASGNSVSVTSLTDISNSVHQDAILAVYRAGIAGGFADGTFRPGEPVSRGQMAAFLARGLGLTASGAAPFGDVTGTTHAESIAAVWEAGIAGGFADGTFRPDAAVSRGQMAAFLARALGLEASGPPPFSDVADSAHLESIAAVAEAGIAGGFPDGTFRPETAVSRGQMATFLTRALDLD